MCLLSVTVIICLGRVGLEAELPSSHCHMRYVSTQLVRSRRAAIPGSEHHMPVYAKTSAVKA